MFKYTLDNKRYHTLNYYYRNKFGEKVFKISLNAGFSCPNIDGTKGYGGCIYCSKSGSGEFAGNINDNLSIQFDKIKKVMTKKWPSGKYIGYFQARSNTYAPLDKLKEAYELILAKDNVIGLSIATRCDAISDEVLDYLEELNKRCFLTIELGMQTIHDKTAKLINRCHTLNEFDNMVKTLRKRNINVVVHIINSLPYETNDMMLDTVKHLNKLDIQGVKFHMLEIIKDTPLEVFYKNNNIKLLSREEYIDIVIKQLELLNPKIVIHRIVSDTEKDSLIAPLWLLKKTTIINDIDKEMKKRDTYQGKLYK